MFDFRTFNPVDSEYLACKRLMDLNNPDSAPVDIEVWKHGDAKFPPDVFRHRFVVENQGELIAFGSVLEPYWLEVAGKFSLDWTVNPQYDLDRGDGKSIHDVIHAHCLELLSSFDVHSLLTYAAEDKDVKIGWLRANGYAVTMRYPNSILKVENFDFAPFEGHVARIKETGIQFVDLAHLQAHDPDWHDKLFKAWVEIDLDVPSPDPPQPVPLSEFNKMFEHPAFSPHLWTVAVDQSAVPPGAYGPYAGLTAIFPPTTDPKRWWIGLTGVCRAYRRRGIALAIKLESIALAVEHEIDQFETGNEENNPLYQVNVRLGFTPKPASLDWEKVLKPVDDTAETA